MLILAWLQRWLGELYSHLYARFGREAFTFSEAVTVSGAKEEKLAVAFSKLHAATALIIFRRSRPRVYRLLDPRNYLLLAGGVVGALRLRREEHVQLVYDIFRVVRDKMPLTSFAVYGSVARGDATPSSDLDLLLISDSFGGSVASRIDALAWVEDAVVDERRFLRAYSYRPLLSFYPLRRDEAQRLPLLFLDLTEDAVLLYDDAHFLADTLAQLRARLQLLGARRVRKAKHWYWDLKPSFRFGEVIEI